MEARIESVEALYALALAIEHEAAQRYAGLAREMDHLGREAPADLFHRLAALEAEHAYRIGKKTYGMTLPWVPPEQYGWRERELPLPDRGAGPWGEMTPMRALEIALAAERRAKAFFESVVAGSSDAGIRALAAEFAREEAAHIAWVEAAIQRCRSMSA